MCVMYDVCVSWFVGIVYVYGGILSVVDFFLVVVFVAGCEGCVFIVFG